MTWPPSFGAGGHVNRTPGLLTAATESGLIVDGIAFNAAAIMFGGIETIEGMLSNTVLYLLSAGHPRPSPDDEPTLEAVVEESLCLEPAAARVDRYATRDTQLPGVQIPGGDLVITSLAAATRDPAAFPGPDRFLSGRSRGGRYLAFARGPHGCLGATLARRQTVIALQELLALPDRPPRSIPGSRFPVHQEHQDRGAGEEGGDRDRRDSPSDACSCHVDHSSRPSGLSVHGFRPQTSRMTIGRCTEMPRPGVRRARRCVRTPHRLAVIRFVAFTESIPVGKKLAGLAAAVMKPTMMEPDGHAPVIVCPDVDPAEAVLACVCGKFVNASEAVDHVDSV